MTSNITLTTIKPASLDLVVSFRPRSKEGEAEKLTVYAQFPSFPAELLQCQNENLKAFAMRAYKSALTEILKETARAGKDSMSIPSISDLFAETKREFLITAKDLKEWISSHALPILYAAIATKSGFSVNDPKVVKKGNAYGSELEAIASRGMMMQESIDSCLRVLELVYAVEKQHPYTANVIDAIAAKQDRLNAYLKEKAEGDAVADIDF